MEVDIACEPRDGRIRPAGYQNCIAAAQEALKFQPDLAAAYNNLATAYNDLGMWNRAIQAAIQAVRIDPNFQVAKGNLQYALSQKQKASAARR